MSFFATLAERRILEAINDGLLDDLSLKGQPIRQEDLSAVPEELRMGYKILKDAGFLPEELQLRREIVSLQEMLEACNTPEERREARKKLGLRRLQFEMMMEKRGRSLAVGEYKAKLEAKLAE